MHRRVFIQYGTRGNGVLFSLSLSLSLFRVSLLPHFLWWLLVCGARDYCTSRWSLGLAWLKHIPSTDSEIPAAATAVAGNGVHHMVILCVGLYALWVCFKKMAQISSPKAVCFHGGGEFSAGSWSKKESLTRSGKICSLGRVWEWCRMHLGWRVNCLS